MKTYRPSMPPRIIKTAKLRKLNISPEFAALVEGNFSQRPDLWPNRAAMRQVLLQPAGDGWWAVSVPSLPGANSQGHSKADALCMVKEAIELIEATMRALGEDIPIDPLNAVLEIVQSR